jgi:Domain of unknown function (DUF3786)
MDIEKWGDSPFDEPRAVLESADAAQVASYAGAFWFPGDAGSGRMVVPVLSGEVEVRFPEISVEAPPELGSFVLKLLTLLYLSKTDGTRPSGNWIAYRELPKGRFYEPVVKRIVEDPVARVFGTADPRVFQEACLSIGGKPEEFGDVGFSFALFPRVTLCFILWLGDSEFEPRAQVLFDTACPHHLNAFDLRMGAQEVSGRLTKKGPAT